jgi:hypothetical protein
MCFPIIIFIHLSFPLQEDVCFDINLHPHIFDKSPQLNLFFIFKFTFVEVSIFLVFYFQIWDLWESNNYLKLDRSPLSSSISFHCAYICSPVAITSLNLLINFKFCLFYSHSHYTSLLLLIWTLLTQMVSLHFYQILKVSLKSSTSWKSHLNQ